MPFDVGRAAAHVRRVVLRFNDEKLTIHYNAGAKFKDYQQATQKFEAEYRDLIDRASRRQEDEDPAAREEAEKRLQERVRRVRRDLAENICMVIESWDLEGDRDYIRSLMPEKDRKQNADVTGQGEIPVSGAWLDALPLPDEFILAVVGAIGEDFQEGGSSGKQP